jgi:hypothetical protein
MPRPCRRCEGRAADAKAVLADAKAVPADAKAVPADAKAVPADAKAVPADAKAVPAAALALRAAIARAAWTRSQQPKPHKQGGRAGQGQSARRQPRRRTRQ